MQGNKSWMEEIPLIARVEESIYGLVAKSNGTRACIDTREGAGARKDENEGL